jgi:hypothetical protein
MGREMARRINEKPMNGAPAKDFHQGNYQQRPQITCQYFVALNNRFFNFRLAGRK